MAQRVEPIPNPSTPLSPYICCNDATKAIEFYKAAFGAEEVMRIADSSGKVGHAELRIGVAGIMVCDEYPELNVRSPAKHWRHSGDVASLCERCRRFYGKSCQCWIDRKKSSRRSILRRPRGKIHDPFGHVWWIASRKEILSTQEVLRRAQEMYTQK